jgi:hypothetical protein
MATFLEFHLKGGGCAIIDTGVIGGAIAKGHDASAPGTTATPTLVLLRGGETLEVIGESPMLVIARMVKVRKTFREMPGADVLVDWLRPLGEGEDAAGGEPGAA